MKNRENCVVELPAGYVERYRLELQKDKKKAVLINLLALLIALPLLVLGHFLVPATSMFPFTDDMELLPGILGKWVLAMLCIIVYIILHELVHGICMKAFGCPKVRYGFSLLYAYAGSEAYFRKRPYLIIALAPVVVWGIVLLVLTCVVNDAWFWVVYLVQIQNLSGAAGDLYVFCRFSRLPSDLLVRDTGTSMTVYTRGE